MPWALRISCSGASGTSVGTAVALSPALAVSCEHVVRGADVVSVRAGSSDGLEFVVVDEDRELDVAVLAPAEGDRRRIGGGSVVVPRWLWRGRWPSLAAGAQAVWAESCTAEAETARRMEVSVQRGQPDERRVQFTVTNDRQGARHGHSGGPVLELDHLSRVPRLLGLVRARDEQSKGLVDGAGAGWLVPVERIAERFPVVRALVEAPVERSDVWRTHWEPRSRGVVHTRDHGFF